MDIGDTEHPSGGMLATLGEDPIIYLAAGHHHSCAVTSMGDLLCWGRNDRGQLGQGNTQYIGDNEAPSSADPVSLPEGMTVLELALGEEHSCALSSTGEVLCWGRNDVGQLGQSTTTDWGDNGMEYPSALSPIDLGGTATHITAGQDHTCALLDTGDIRCWGGNASGQLGIGNTTNIGDNELPSTAPVVDVGGAAIQLSAGHNHTCAVLEDYSVVCWGVGASGRLGYGTVDNIGDDEAPATAGTVSILGPP